MQRRDFIKWSLGSILTTRFSRQLYAAPASNPEQGFVAKKQAGLTHQEWQVMIAVQAHLFPTETDSPGAQDVNAAAYLHNVLIDPKFDSADRAFTRAGILDLQGLSSRQYSKSFVQLENGQRERLLRQYETTSQGSRWLNMILEYIMEAMLTDPVYGGNPGGIGWQWLGHTPGLPRPPTHKRYFLL